MTAMMMLTSGMAWAQTLTLNISTSGTYTLTSIGNGNQFQCGNSTYDYLGNVTAGAGVDITIVFDNTKTILSTGQFNVSGDGGSITLQLGSNCEACTPSKPTLKTYEARGTAWFLMANYNTDPANKSITVLGKNPENITTDSPENLAETSSHWDGNFVLDGGAAAMKIIGDTMNRKVRLATGGIIHHFERDGGGQPFRVQHGTLTLTKVTLQNYATGGSSGNNQVSSAGIQIMTANNMAVGVKVALTQCHFTKLAASSGYCAVRMQGTKGALVTSNYVNIDHCLFDHCYCLSGDATTNDAGTAISEAGVVRTLSNFRSPVSVTNCKLENNLGPSIRHHEPYNMTIQNNIVQDNWNKGRGGGMQLRGPATIEGCKVRRNTATGDGGGIFYGTFVDATDMNPGHSILTMDNNSVVSGNKSYGNGGGIMLCGEQIHPGSSSNNQKVAYYAFGTNGQLIAPYEPIRLEFELNGGTISDNRSSGQGGGVCITRNKNCTFYGTNCYLRYGTITGNKTWGNNGLTGEGGGVALITSSDYDNGSISPSSTHPANTPSDPYDIKPQDINVVISEAGATEEMKIQNNSGSDGGGIYVDAHPVTYHDVTSKVTTIVYDYATVGGTTVSLGNKATNNGGGLYVKKGTVSIRKQGGSHSPTLQKNTASSGSGGGIFLNEGNVDMISAIIGGGDYSNPNNIISYGNTAGVSGGGLYVNTGSITMLSTSVSSNTATSGDGGGIYVNTGDVFINRTEQGGITPSQITYNKAHNGGGIYNHAGSILAFGTLGGDENLHVQINNNQATAGSGGGIYCMGSTSNTSYDIRLRRVDIKSNSATANGGGIYLHQGMVSVVNGVIDGNSASGNGGGVYTHDGNIDINPTGDERNATRITNNTAAGNGGGLNTHSGLITVKGKDANQRIIVSGNKAGHGSNAKGSGGGVFCMGLDGNTEYITMRHVDLINNRANGDGTEVSNVTTGCGGGMYLQQGKIAVTDVKIQNNHAEWNGGGINNHSGNIDVDGCVVGGNQYYNSSYSIDANGVVSGTAGGNKADNSGGGIYTRLGDIDIEDYVETSGNITRIESKVTYNEAAKNGGGIDTRQGTIYINRKEMDDQIEVAFNKAERGGGLYANAGTIVTYNAQIHDNTATLHGGGANNHSGNIILYGGMLSNNIAKEGHGGGAYTNVGDIDLFQFPSTELQNPTLNHGTKVYNNIAKLNGGAFNNHTGRVDVRHATIYNNTSTLGNGGAIYCEGPHANVDRGLGYTIRLLCSDMVQNKTRGQDGTETAPTGRGGGIYLKYGSIYAHYSNILDNEANIAGGGLNNHEGNILLYGCDITGNRALELDGGGIFIKSGSITTGPSTVREAAPTSAKATIVQNNTAYRNGGGIINLDGNITLNGDLIGGATSNLGNKALTGNGGGVYIANGIINMKGGQIDNNTAENGKGGGVYSGGGEFNIGEREGNPTPIVLLVDTEVKRVTGGQTATVHYHLVDQGKYDNVSNVAHGIIWGTPETEVIYGSAAGTTAGYTYTQGEPACQRITIPSNLLNQSTTYEVKAFYRYTTGGNVITGYSETIEFVTFSDSEPLVISGSVSNITKNSAQGSGRVMDNGRSAITARGVAIKKESDASFTLIPSTETTEFFTVDLTGLDPNTKYIAKAYATNSNGTSYGNPVEFTTLKNTPDMGNDVVSVTTSIENGVIVATASFTMPSGTTFGNGTNDVKAYGFIWSRDDDPELSTDHTIAGTLTQGTTTFTATYTGVTQGITFYVRAYASTIESGVTPNTDITNYSLSAATQHVAPMLDDSPVVRAIEISGITQNSATITCQIYSGYQAGTTQYGVHLDNYTETNPANTYTSAYIACTTGISDPDDNGYRTYTVQLTNLIPGTTYYLKAYATNDGGTHYNYGNGYNFTALPIMQPNVVITSVDNIQKTSATINCSVEDGGGNITAYGIKYSTDPNMANPRTVAGSNLSGSTFSVALDNTNHDLLTAHTTYYVQAYATNSAGTHTCQAVSFTTDYDHPSVAFTDNGTIIPISGVDFTISNDGNNNYSYQYTAVGNYTVTPNATSGEAVKTHGVCWSIFHDPTRRISAVSDSNYQETTNANITTADNYFQTFHPAYPNTKYYVHAYVSTSTPDANDELADIVYDPAGSNITFVSLPIVHTGGATAITNSSASLTVNINSPDREHHLRKYGVCWVESVDDTQIPTRTTGFYTENNITAASPTAVSYSLTANVGGTAGTPKTYRYRAYCINENSDAQGNIAYGDIKEFTTTQYTITGTTDPTEAGRVSYEAGLTAGGGWNGTDPITVKAHAYDGWHFENWTLDNGTSSHSSSNPLTETPTAGNHTYQANFKAIVSATVNPENTGSVSGAGNYEVGTTCTLTATAESGYTFLYWTDDAGNIIMDATGETPEGDSYTFTVAGPVTVTANFTSRGRSSNNNSTINAPRTRDIYPAPAREPWDWDDDEVVIARKANHEQNEVEAIQTNNSLDCHAPLAMTETTDTIVPTRATTTAPVNKPSINNNSAEYGGGVYVEHNANNPAKIVFAGGSTTTTTGTINENTATEAGGGIYISQGASMQMKGHCQVNSNHVPAGKKGGGIYLDGILLVGDQATDLANAHALQVNLNWIGDGAYDENTRNNVYLPTDPILTGDALHKMRVITLLSDISGKTGTQYNSKIGLSVDRGFREVIYSEKDEHESPGVASNKRWLEKLMPETGSLTLNSAIFEDSQQYYALHVTPSDDLFDEDYIYLWSCWTSIVAKDPNTSASPFYVADDTHYEKDDNNVWHIKTNYGLAWFSSIINGLNNQTADPTAKAVIENDLDMSAYFWVPLGSVSGSTGSGTEIAFTDGGYYQGTFNGQGHVIKGLICTYMTGIKKYGLFGTVNNNAIVKNTFVDDYRFSTYWQKSGSTLVETGYRMGGIAAETEGNAVISNCEARGTMKTPYCTANETYVGGLVGLMKGTNEVHSSMAMPEVSGKAQKVGGLVGQINASNVLKNSFANMKLGNIDNTTQNPVNVGGLVGNNLGTVENCYSRLQNTYTTQNPAPNNFYWFAGANTGTITYCYAPERSDFTSIAYVPTGTTANPTGHGKYTATVRFSGKYGFKHRDHQLTAASSSKEPPATYISAENNNTLSGGLMTSLNAWVADNTGYSVWTRTMASPINDDYPILKFADFNAVGSEDSIYMHYKHNVDDLIEVYTKINPETHRTPSIYLYDTIRNGANILPITKTNIGTTHPNVMLAINENVGILQSVQLKARVGVTIRNSRKGDDDQTRDPNWHLFSSAINKVPMGIVYDYTGDQDYNNRIPNQPSLIHDLWSDRTRFDPPKTQWYQSDNSDNAATYDPNSVGYFPTNTPYGTWRNIPASEGFFDLYAYDEFYYHWINFKRAGKEGYRDHWHMDRDVVDGNHYLIKYTNEEKMPQGKGYLMALSSESMMMADGTLNTGSFTTDVTCTPVGTNLPPNGHGTGAYDYVWRSLNLIGNPYQSYLDFKAFVANNNNKDLLYNENGYYCYATRDDDTYEYIYYTTHASENYVGASQFIHPHQGFFVKVNSGGKLHFTDNMRVVGKESPFRGEDLNYPLVNLLCYEASGKRNYTTVEINRPQMGGGLKMKNLKTGKALIYARFDDNDFQTLFAPVGVNTVPVRFETEEDGTFTLRWSKYHGDFSYLHLIDNLTGADIDCLTTDEYRFEAKTTDYVSRFKLVFNCTGIDEPEVPEPVEGPTVFAFLMGDELIVNGEGTLQLFDMNGRCLMTTQAVGQQSSVSLPKVSAGIYLLRLTGDKQVKVQKMVIK